MKIFNRLLDNKKDKISNKHKVQEISTLVLTNVEQISANDGIKFNNEGIPVEFTLNIHEITKRAFTPTTIYNEPSYYPWAEQARLNSLNKPIKQTNNIETTPRVILSDEIEIYNGYPINVEVNGKTCIVINNLGDWVFNFKKSYIVNNSNNEFYGNGKIINVLDCNTYNHELILQLQSDLLYFNSRES